MVVFCRLESFHLCSSPSRGQQGPVRHHIYLQATLARPLHGQAWWSVLSWGMALKGAWARHPWWLNSPWWKSSATAAFHALDCGWTQRQKSGQTVCALDVARLHPQARRVRREENQSREGTYFQSLWKTLYFLIARSSWASRIGLIFLWLCHLAPPEMSHQAQVFLNTQSL